MQQGGTIMIRLSYDPTAQMVELGVRDTGCGMPPDVLRNIFDPFYSTKSGPDASGKGGTGLGLSMCRDIIESAPRPHPRRQHRRPRHGVYHQTPGSGCSAESLCRCYSGCHCWLVQQCFFGCHWLCQCGDYFQRLFRCHC